MIKKISGGQIGMGRAEARPEFWPTGCVVLVASPTQAGFWVAQPRPNDLMQEKIHKISILINKLLLIPDSIGPSWPELKFLSLWPARAKNEWPVVRPG